MGDDIPILIRVFNKSNHEIIIDTNHQCAIMLMKKRGDFDAEGMLEIKKCIGDLKKTIVRLVEIKDFDENL